MLKKTFVIVLASAALLALTACNNPAVIHTVDESVAETVSVELPTSGEVSVSLPNDDPVILSDTEAKKMYAILAAAVPADGRTVASSFVAFVSVGEENPFECSFFESEDGKLVITLPNGEVRVSDSADFYQLISGSAFADYYSASAPVTLTCGEDDFTMGVRIRGELTKTLPNGNVKRTEQSVNGREGNTLLIDSLDKRFALNFEVQPTTALATVRNENGKSVFEGTLEKLSDFLPTVNGEYDVTVQAEWENGGRTGFDGSCEYTFKVEYDIPCVVQAAQTTVVQGQPILVYIRNADPDELEVSAEGIKYDPYFLEQGDLRVLIYPTHYNTPAGSGTIYLSVDGEDLEIPFTIQEYNFEEQYLEITEELSESTVNNDTANYVYTQTAAEINEIIDEEVIYFSEPFIQPIQNDITTEFGMRRYVNGTYQSVHAGIDIYAEEGDPVPASNAGRVVFADELQLTGNTVVIEHGCGIKTWYYHMSELKVKEGDMVELGQTIGLVGSTGFSTGPHLHFAVTVDGIYISPWYLFGYNFIDSAYRENAVPFPSEQEESEESEENNEEGEEEKEDSEDTSEDE